MQKYYQNRLLPAVEKRIAVPHDTSDIEGILDFMQIENPEVFRMLNHWSKDVIGDTTGQTMFAGALVYQALHYAGPLPEVEREREIVFRRDAKDYFRYDKIGETIDRVKKENPKVHDFILSTMNGSFTPNINLCSGLLPYLLLESQAERDQLKRMYEL
jgi:hypothetical protein